MSATATISPLDLLMSFNSKLAMELFQADRGARFSVENLAAILGKGRLDGGAKLDRILLVLGHLDLVTAGRKMTTVRGPMGSTNATSMSRPGRSTSRG